MKSLISHLFVFLFGIVFGYGISYYSRTPFLLDEKLNVVQILTLIVTCFFAFYVPAILQKNLSINRIEKDLLIKKVELFRDTIRVINKNFIECYNTKKVPQEISVTINEDFKTASNLLFNFEYLISHCNYSALKEEINDLNIRRRKYKGLMTGGGFQSPDFFYDISQYINENKIFVEIENQIDLLIIKINRL